MTPFLPSRYCKLQSQQCKILHYKQFPVKISVAAFLCFVFVTTNNLYGETYYVATNGLSSNQGTIDKPFANIDDITNRPPLVSHLKPGDTILIREGTYDINVNIVNVSGTETAPITIQSYPGEWAIFDGSKYTHPSPEKIRLEGSWYILKNFEVRNSPGYGISIQNGASNNVVQNIRLHDNYLAGLEVRNGASNNHIINCDSYRNFDRNELGENADGFAANYNLGRGNEFIGCRAWHNSDDGFDLYGAENVVQIKNCWSFKNGIDVWGIGNSFIGDGNGFKLGQPGPGSQHQIYNNLAWSNQRHGFDFNGSTTKIFVYNNSSYNNSFHNFRFENAGHWLRNNLSIQGSVRMLGDVDDEYNSWNNPPAVTVDNKDFLSLDDTIARGHRQSDGSLPKSNFLKLSSNSALIDAGINIGLSYQGVAPDLGAFESDISNLKIDPILGLLLH